MITSINKKIIVFLVILLAAGATATADPLSSFEHPFNPALMSAGNRFILEVGANGDFGVSNNYFALQDIFTEHIEINLDDMYENMSEKGLRFSTSNTAAGHGLVSLFGLSFGGYATIDNIASANVPGAAIELLAKGNTMGEPIEGQTDIYGRVFADAGMYGGFKWGNLQFGLKLGQYAPIFYTDKEAKVTYNLTTDNEAGTMTASADVNIPVYSIFDLSNMESIDPNTVLEEFSGTKADFGVMYMKGRKPMMGVHLNGITLNPAVVKNKSTMSITADVTVNNLADNYDSEEKFSNNVSEFTTVNEKVEQEISMPLRLGGFYRQPIPLVDLIARGELTFEKEDIKTSVGLAAEGNFWPLSWFSLGIGYNRVLWESFVGARINLYLMEVGVDIGMSSPDFTSMFSTTGVSASMYMAMGF